MLDLKPRLHEPRVLELLALSVYPDPLRLAARRQQYLERHDLHLHGLEREGVPVAVIGLCIHDHRATIENIATHESVRGRGCGRQLLREAIRMFGLLALHAETDASAVGFYRACGFSTTSLGEKHPGIERFACTLERTDRSLL